MTKMDKINIEDWTTTSNAEDNIKDIRAMFMNKVTNKIDLLKVFYNFHQITSFHKVNITTSSNHKDFLIW